MKNTHQCLKFFTAQSGPNDCGLACMAMILNYTGKRREANRIMKQSVSLAEGLSLLDLRQLAHSAKLTSRCVRMDLVKLREVGPPCILHVGKPEAADHFVVCFGSTIKKGVSHYLIADPAIGVHLMNEHELVQIWKGNAALYFEGLGTNLIGRYKPLWAYLLKLESFRSAFMFTVPLLNLFSTFLGIGFSWMLQRGLDYSFPDHSLSLLACLLILLFIITSFKNIINYIQRRLLIVMTGSIGEHLHTKYVNSVLGEIDTGKSRSAQSVRKTLGDIRRIQQAVATLASVLASESLMLSFVIAALLIYDPFIGSINIFYFLCALAVAKARIPQTLFDSMKLQQLVAEYERKLIVEFCVNDNPSFNLRSQTSFLHYYHNYAKCVAGRLNMETLQYDFLGTVNVIAAFSVAIYKIHTAKIAYTDLVIEVILSYFTIIIVAKICNALAVVTDGALPVLQFLDE